MLFEQIDINRHNLWFDDKWNRIRFSLISHRLDKRRGAEFGRVRIHFLECVCESWQVPAGDKNDVWRCSAGNHHLQLGQVVALNPLILNLYIRVLLLEVCDDILDRIGLGLSAPECEGDFPFRSAFSRTASCVGACIFTVATCSQTNDQQQ